MKQVLEWCFFNSISVVPGNMDFVKNYLELVGIIIETGNKVKSREIWYSEFDKYLDISFPIYNSILQNFSYCEINFNWFK